MNNRKKSPKRLVLTSLSVRTLGKATGGDHRRAHTPESLWDPFIVTTK